MSSTSGVPHTIPPAAPGTFDAERGTAAARKRWATPPAPATPEELDRLVGELTTPASITRLLAQVARWGVLGRLTSAQVSAIAKAADVALKAHDAEMNRKTIAELERRVKALTRELEQARKGARDGR